MDEEKPKHDWHFIIHLALCIALLAIAVFAMFFTTGCATTGKGTDNYVLEHQKQLTEYQGTVQYYFGRIDGASERVEYIRGKSENLTGTIDETIELFDEYQRAVEQLLRDYHSLRVTVENEIENNSSAGNNPDS